MQEASLEEKHYCSFSFVIPEQISVMQEASKEEKQKAMVTADKLLKDGGYSKTTKVKIIAQ